METGNGKQGGLAELRPPLSFLSPIQFFGSQKEHQSESIPNCISFGMNLSGLKEIREINKDQEVRSVADETHFLECIYQRIFEL